MSSVVQKLARAGKIKPPPFVEGGTMYETIMGSMAYGVSNDNSDMDIYGFCIPPKEVVFPHLAGDIPGFGRQKVRFEQFQQHHIPGDKPDQTFDISIYSIVKYFHLAMENNPNIIDSLFTPRNCVVHSTKISDMVRDQRRNFLHKGSWHKFKGYAYSQLNKIRTKKSTPDSRRYESVKKYGYDVKFAYHVVRLLDEAHQILAEGDIDLLRNREQLKSIRRGEWTLIELEDWASAKEKDLEALYTSSKLPHSPNEKFIKALLMSCMEEHYGSLADAVVSLDKHQQAIAEILSVLAKYRV
jgi:uncharacterized protein